MFHTIGDFDGDDLIEFSQWTTTDWSNLTHHTETVNEYVNMKSEIDSSMVLFLGDFAENYQFVIQDEVQGFHWNNS